MTKIAARLYPCVGYRQVVLTLPEQLRIPCYNHRDQNRLYSKFMALAQACLEELVHDQRILDASNDLDSPALAVRLGTLSIARIL